ncbi:hypothetical protein PF005_g16788 [Phytophthora fragariae]|uniref:Uncharacterized protein n=1 Tax=Phytophthora fragariae TaxID=53985 RepID=A0A6A3VW28_9STRA|nr:hypothetical protein PF009_g18142 [Phytophthora fragariae]KAE9078412.1 hypothetical protein PF006_g27725 [Phytophthora fragariae]KAE9091379.1 hypothetical protein PF007_g18901 [Phytophthora fragariae]KAE9174558.1 hypothetical protein PF002_g29014 [Phytophthora fragariae]KAE9196652.1 hypothetical protein PF005_g16788 [Phytophthora fragariae]
MNEEVVGRVYERVEHLVERQEGAMNLMLTKVEAFYLQVTASLHVELDVGQSFALVPQVLRRSLIVRDRKGLDALGWAPDLPQPAGSVVPLSTSAPVVAYSVGSVPIGTS